MIDRAIWRGEYMLNTVYCADYWDLLAALPDASIDMVFTDPPYGHNNNNDGDLISRWEVALSKDVLQEPRPIANDGAEANDIYRAALREFRRVLKPGAVCCCCCCGGGPDPQFARWSIWMDEIFDFKQMVVWDKGPMGMGWHYRRSYEVVLAGQVPGAACNWYDNSHRIENIIRHIRKQIPTADDHPTPKPIPLAEWFIRLHTQPADVVLDPFCGGGSTLMAARNLGRNFIGGDVDPQWAQASRDRLTAPYTLALFPHE